MISCEHQPEFKSCQMDKPPTQNMIHIPSTSYYDQRQVINTLPSVKFEVKFDEWTKYDGDDDETP